MDRVRTIQCTIPEVLNLFQSRPLLRLSLLSAPHLTSKSNTKSKTTIVCHYPAFQQHVSAILGLPLQTFHALKRCVPPSSRTTALFS